MKIFDKYVAGELISGDLVRFEDEDEIEGRLLHSYLASVLASDGNNVAIRVESVFAKPDGGPLTSAPAHGPDVGDDLLVEFNKISHCQRIPR